MGSGNIVKNLFSLKSKMAASEPNETKFETISYSGGGGGGGAGERAIKNMHNVNQTDKGNLAPPHHPPETS